MMARGMGAGSGPSHRLTPWSPPAAAGRPCDRDC